MLDFRGYPVCHRMWHRQIVTLSGGEKFHNANGSFFLISNNHLIIWQKCDKLWYSEGVFDFVHSDAKIARPQIACFLAEEQVHEI